MRKDRGCRGLLARASRDEDGAVLIEFAIAFPLLMLVMAAFIEFGSMVHLKMRLDETVSATSSYAIMNHERLAEIGPDQFGMELVTLLAAGASRQPSSYRVSVNDSVEIRMEEGAIEEVAAPGDMDDCYCPQRNASGFSFGSVMACEATCQDGTQAGRFIAIEASKDYAPLFSAYGLAEGRTIRTMAIVPILRWVPD